MPCHMGKVEKNLGLELGIARGLEVLGTGVLIHSQVTALNASLEPPDGLGSDPGVWVMSRIPWECSFRFAAGLHTTSH